MNLEELVARRANARLDAIVPNPYKKEYRFPVWARFALPTALAVIIAAIPFVAMRFSARGGQSSQVIVSSPVYQEEPGPQQLLIEGKRYLMQTDLKTLPRCVKGKSAEELKGEQIGIITEQINSYLAEKEGFTLYRIAGSDSKAAIMATDGQDTYFYLYEPELNGTDVGCKDYGLLSALDYCGVRSNYSIEIYGMGQDEEGVISYINLLETLEGETAENIIASIDSLSSDYEKFYDQLSSPTTKRNPEGDLMGVGYKFIITNGNDVFPITYMSQFHTISYWNSRIDIYESEAYALLDDTINMNYDPNHDPLRNWWN